MSPKYVKSGFFRWQDDNLLEQSFFPAQLWSSAHKEPNKQGIQPRILASEQGTPAFAPLGTEPWWKTCKVFYRYLEKVLAKPQLKTKFNEEGKCQIIHQSPELSQILLLTGIRQIQSEGWDHWVHPFKTVSQYKLFSVNAVGTWLNTQAHS